MGENRDSDDERPTDAGGGRGASEKGEYEYLYEKYDLKKEYRHQRGFTEDESYHGDGKYPPDWGERRTDIDDPVGGRREAIAEHQDHTCARCRRDLREFEYFHAHHYRPIGEEGTHELGNLLALCGPCHKLIHPDNDFLDDDWRDAPMFPAPNADTRTATVRKPVTPAERERYLPELELLASSSSEGENTFTTSEATYSLSPADAIDAGEDLSALLDNRGLAPDREVTVHVVNPIHSPLRDATVEVTLPLGDHGSYALESTTDADGEATFSVPEAGRPLPVRVTKEDFETASASVALGDDPADEPVTETVKMTPVETRGATESAAERGAARPSDADDSGSRRGFLKAAGAAALLGLGYAAGTGGRLGSLFGSSGGAGGGSGDGSSAGGSGGSPLSAGWTFDTDTAATVQSLATAGDGVVFNTKVGTVTALGPSGEERWTADFRETMTNPLAVTESAVVAASRNKVQAHDPASGDRLWSFEGVPSGIDPAVAASDDVVALALPYEEDSDRQNLVVLDAGTGQERWRARTKWPSRPSIHDGDLLVPSGSDLVAFDVTADDPPDTRESVSTGVGSASALAIGDGRGYVSGIVDGSYFDEYTHVAAIDLASLTALWDEQVHDHHEYEPTPTKPAVADGTVVWSSTAALDVLDDSGAARWQAEPTPKLTSAPTPLGGTLYVGVADGEDDSTALRGFDLDSGDSVGTVPIDTAAVAGAEDGEALYVGTDDGRVERFTPN